MITKGNITNGRFLAQHLLKDENDRVEVLEIKGAVLNDLDAAIDDWRDFAKGTRCEKPLYHAQLSPDRTLNREEWDKTIGIFEKEMGLEGYPRAVVLHEKEGREHVHLVYSRIDLDTMKAWSNHDNYAKHERVSREVERELGLEKTQGVHAERGDNPRPDRTPSHDDMQQGKRTGRDPREIKAEVSALYAKANGDGAAFLEGLEAAGYTLAQGDRRDFVLVGQEGGVYSLSRMANARVDALRDMLHTAPLGHLCSVEEAQAKRFDRRDIYADTRQTARTGLGTENTPPRLSVTLGQEKNPTYMKAQRELAVLYAVAKGDGRELLAGLEEKGYTLAIGDRRNYVVTDREGHVHDLVQATKGTTGFLREMLKDAPLPTRPWLESSNVHDVMRCTYDMLKSANAPDPAIIQAIDRFEKSINALWNKFENVAIKHSLPRQEFEQYLHTKNAKAEQADMPRKSTGEMFVEIFERQGFSFARHGKGNCLLVDRNGETHRFTFENNRPLTRALREMLRDTLSIDELPSLKEVRAQRRAGGQMESALHTAPVRLATAEQTKSTEPTREPPRKATTKAADPSPSILSPRGVGLRGAGAVGGLANVLTKAMDGILDFFVGASPPAKMTVGEVMSNPQLRRQKEQERAQHNQALDHLSEALAEGRSLPVEDMQALARGLTHKEFHQLKAQGEIYLLTLVRNREENRTRDPGGGRERER
ncbi:MAG: relaxase/mobilization nuclease domain-containing protein [Magnetococcus sp. YQC-9]